MKVSVLGSGSRGNAVLVTGGTTRILVDAGFSARDLESRLRSLRILPETLDAIVVTHDHGDHTRGVGVFARRHGTPVFLTEATLQACGSIFRGGEDTRLYRAGCSFTVGHLRVEPFLTVHDARDPVAVAVTDEETGVKLGVATDLGRPTAQVRHALSGSDFLVLEANHDRTMLHESSYPWSVKSRISSSHGHLSNEAAAQLALELLHPGLAGVVLAHLSAECNHPELAESVVGAVLRKAGFRGLLKVASQDRPTELMNVVELRQRLSPHQLTLF
jgi:phosphoribosyl 1,2-cyclic phosphodiesterase